MKDTCIFIIAMMTYFEVAIAAQGDGVLSGYLVLSDDSKCLGLDAQNDVGASSLGDTSERTLGIICIKMYLVEGNTEQKYHIFQLSDQALKLKLEANKAPVFVDDGTETLLQFSDGTGLIDAATAADTTSVTTKDSPFLIQLDGATASDDTVCLSATPDYLESACGSVLWYFITADCTDSNCATCIDASKCDHCTNGTHVVNDEKTACLGCGKAMPDCTTCSDSTGEALCSECANGKTLHSERKSCIDACTVNNCKFCDNDPATCDTCDDDFDKDGDACVEATTPAPMTTEGVDGTTGDSTYEDNDGDDDMTTTTDGSPITAYMTLTVVLSVVLLKSAIGL